MNSALRCFSLGLAASCGLWLPGATQAATPAAMSVCPPVVGTPEGMRNVMESLGASRRLAERCEVPRGERELMQADAMDAERPCLTELAMPAREIEEALRRGEANGEAIYQRSGAKDVLCEKTREEFREGAAQIRAQRAAR